jgi:GMP synthase-like glutamine amidotransferase
MRIVILQHSPSTPPGSILDWVAAQSGNTLKPSAVVPTQRVIELFNNDPLPEVESFDWVISLGGPMNADQIVEHPWLESEKKFLREAVAAKKICLGICLGSQLLAQVLGGSVTALGSWEAGWHAVTIGSDTRLMVFQWHQDGFSLPPRATLVATNKICENQGFMFGDRVVGLQFHPEATEEWVKECTLDPNQPSGPHVQATESMLTDCIFIHPMRKWFFELLDRLNQLPIAAKETS